MDICAIVTTDANGVVGGIHSHMPVILRQDNYAGWLDPGEIDMKKAVQTIEAFA